VNVCYWQKTAGIKMTFFGILFYRDEPKNLLVLRLAKFDPSIWGLPAKKTKNRKFLQLLGDS